MKVGDLVIVGQIDFDQELFERYIGKIGKIKYICTRKNYNDLKLNDDYFDFDCEEHFCPIAVVFNCFDGEGDNKATFLESELIVIGERK